MNFSISHFLNHEQSKLRVLLVATIPDYNIPWYFWSLIIYPLSVIIDLFTFFIQSVMFTNRVSPQTETLTLFCAWSRKWLIRRKRTWDWNLGLDLAPSLHYSPGLMFRSLSALTQSGCSPESQSLYSVFLPKTKNKWNNSLSLDQTMIKDDNWDSTRRTFEGDWRHRALVNNVARLLISSEIQVPILTTTTTTATTQITTTTTTTIITIITTTTTGTLELQYWSSRN